MKSEVYSCEVKDSRIGILKERLFYQDRKKNEKQIPIGLIHKSHYKKFFCLRKERNPQQKIKKIIL